MRQRKKDKMRGLVTEPLKKSTKPGARKSAPTNKDERAPRAGAARPTEAGTSASARPTGSARPITPAKTSRGKEFQATPVAGMPAPIALKTAEQMPLNKFIAHAGVCGRREAAELVKGGKVVVNGDKIFEPGFKVAPTDKVIVKGKQVYLQKNAVYILLNKPKDYITTANDPEGRKTVLDIIKGATADRVYPVGRLDRNTTGVLLLTNDGELAQKLTHPSFEIKKIYEVTLDRPVAKKDLEAVLAGVTLEDGFVAADACGYANAKDKNVIGIEIHSGRNRIVRRIFEHLGYDVRGLDRVMFANLTKKNVDRGKYRFLQEKEVRLLKFMNKSFVRKSKEEEEEA
jgi:23S rRNA pseudouridine2605 synthase